MAAREAISFTIDAGIREIMLEGVNLAVINAIRSNEDSLNSAATIVADNGRVCCSYNRLVLSFVTRDGNIVAHSLANFDRFIYNFGI